MNIFLNKKEELIIALAVFAIFFIESFVINPFYPFDMDDWHYFSFFKNTVLPLPDDWNPTKVTPEYFQPLVSYIGVKIFTYIFAEINNSPDYLEGIACAYSVFYALIFAIYFCCLYKFIRALLERRSVAISSFLIVFLLHLVAFKATEFGSVYIYKVETPTLLFHYPTSVLFNAILIYCLEKNYIATNQILPKNYLSVGLIVAFSHLCIFSSSMYSTLTAVYLSTLLLFNLKKIKKIKISELWMFIKEWWFALIFLAIWLVSAYLEMHGQRAASVETKNATYLFEGMSLPIAAIKEFCTSLSYIFIAVMVFLLSFCAFLISKKAIDNKLLKTILRYFLFLIIVVIFYLLLGFKAGLHYTLVGLQTGGMLPIILIISCVLANIALNFKKSLMIFTTVFVASSLICLLLSPRFAKNTGYVEAETAYNFDNYVIDSCISATDKNLKSLEIEVPSIWSQNDWPIMYTSGGKRISLALYAFRIIPYQLDITVIPSDNTDLYRKLNILHLKDK